MRLKAPGILIFLISIILAGAAFATALGVPVPIIGSSGYPTLAAAYAILLLGNLIRGF